VVKAAKQAAGQLSGGVVATVAGHGITLSAYRQAYGVMLDEMTSSGVPLDPPTFAACAAGLGRLYTRGIAKTPKKLHIRRPAAPSRAALVAQCRARQGELKQGALSQLIQQRWIQLEAQSEGISVGDAAVRAEVARQTKALGGAAAYRRYLRRAGETPQTAIARLRLDLLEQQLQQRRLGSPVQVTDRQVTQYFAAHRAEFVLPGRKAPKLSAYRTRIRLVLSEEARARRAASATMAFTHRWRAKTVCRPAYASQLCANSASQ
jgi:hypothetical protein